MSVGALDLARRGGLNKKNLSAFIKFLLLAVLLSLLFIGADSLFNSYIHHKNSSVAIYDWDYLWVSKEKEFQSTIGGWEKADRNNSIKYKDDKQYLHLRATVVESAQHRVLSLRSGNNLMDVLVDDKRVISQLGEGYLFSGTPLLELTLEPSSEPHTVEIYMYVPATLDFSSSVARIENSRPEIRLAELAELIFGIIFIGAGLTLFIVSFTAARKTKRQALFVWLGFLCIIFGLSAALNQAGININAFTHHAFYRLTVFLFMLTALGMQIAAANAADAAGDMRWYIYISAVYPVGYIFAPYDAIEMFLLKTFSVWSIISLIGFAAAVIKRGTPSLRSKNAVMTTYMSVLITQALYWASFTRPLSFSGVEAYLLAAGLCIICSVGFFISSSCAMSGRFNGSDKHSMGDSIYERTLRVLAEKTDTNSSHLENVSRYTKAMCDKMKMPPDISDMIAHASMLHDIGKVAIPKAILEKEDLITKDEYDQIRYHVLHGYNILTDPADKFMQTAAVIAKHHHERYDGSGYLGLRNGEIDIYSQITGIADTFDALTSYRSYKKAWSFNEAWEYINIHAGDYFDPELVKVFNSCRKEFWEIYQRRNAL